MPEYKKVIIQWHDDPSINYGAMVAIDGQWTELDKDDDSIFFYFSTHEEYESAKKQDNDLDFWIVEGE